MKNFLKWFSCIALCALQAPAATILATDFTDFANTGNAYSSGVRTNTTTQAQWPYADLIFKPAGAAAANGVGSLGFVQMKASSGTLQLPALDNAASMSFIATVSSGTANLLFQKQNANGWTTLGSFPLTTNGAVCCHTFTNAGTGAVFRFSAGGKATYLHDLVVTDSTADTAPVWSALPSPYVLVGDDFDLELSDYVTGASSISMTAASEYADFEDGYFLFSSADPGTYSFTFRADNEAGFSFAVLNVTVTDSIPSGTAPAIAAIANQTMSLDDIMLEFTVTASGSPAPTFSVTSSDAPSGDYSIDETTGEFSFMPEAAGTFHFTVTASNSAGSDSKSFTVTVSSSTPSATAPVLSSISNKTKVYGSGDVEFTASATGTPAPTFSATSSDAPAGTFEIDENTGYFLFTPPATGTFHFTVTAANSAGSDSKSFAVTVTGTAPAVTVPQTSYSVTLGDDVDFTVTATGNPVPALALSSSTAASADYDFDPSDGYFAFTPSATGTFTFTFTATSSAGSASKTVTVTVASAVVPAPTLTISNETATTADASWTAVSGASSYTLQLATDELFTGGGSVLLAENFDKVAASNSTAIANFDSSTATPGWSGTFVYPNSGAVRVGKASSGQGWIQTPVLAASGSISVVWTAWPWSGDAATVILGISQDGGTTFTEETVTISTSAAVYNHTFALSGSSAVLRWKSSSASKGRFFLDDISVSTASASGSLVSSTVVSGTSHTFTGLAPDSIYYARVKADDGDWSTVVDFLTDEAPGTAPAIAAIADQTYVYGANDGLFALAVSAAGDPAPTFSVTSTDAPAGLFDIGASSGEFSFMPEATGTFHFTVTAANTVGSDSKSFAVTVTGTAPAVTVPQTSYSVTLGDDVDFTVTATGNPAPALALSSSTAASADYDFDPADGYFAFTPSATGTFTFTFTATSSAGSASKTVTVTVASAVVPAPTLTISNETATTADASWTAVSGASSYTLQLATDELFTGGGSVLLAENFDKVAASNSTAIANFDNSTGTPGWSGTFVYPNSGAVRVGKASSGQGWIQTPVLAASGSISVVWTAWPWSGDAATVILGISQDGGTTFSEETVTISTSAAVYTHTFALSGSSAVLRWKSSSASKARFFLDDISVSTASASGSLVSSTVVSGTSHTFIGLAPDSIYYARVKADDGDWSTVVDFLTDEAPGTAPAIAAIADQTYVYGASDGIFTLAVSAAGDPAPSFSVTSTDAPVGLFDIGASSGEFSFMPEATGTFHFTVTAANTVGSDSKSFAVTVTGTAPAVTVPQTSYSVTLGDDVDFTVTATGNPVPALALSSSTAASADYDFDPSDGYFTFTPSATGTFTFTFTATSSAGSASKTVTVTVASAVVPAPTLTISNETATTADASWTAVSGASSYTLQLATDDDFTPGPGYSENFTSFPSVSSYSTNSQTVSSGTWTYDGARFTPGGGANGEGSKGVAQLRANGTLALPPVDHPSKVTVAARASSGTGTLYLQQYASGEWSTIATWTLSTTGTVFNHSIAGSGSAVVLRLTGAKVTYIHDVSVASADGTLLAEITTSSSSYTFTNLDPSTIYCARVKADDGDWSEVELFETEAPAGVAPAIAAIADQTYVYGASDGIFTLAVSATGTPAPSFSVTSTDAPAGLFDIGASSGEFSFMPEATGTFHFTVTAANDISPDATATFTVTVTGTAPAVTPVADKTITLEDGGVEFQVVATGNPPPTFSATSTTAPAGSFTVDPATGVFTFIPEAEGTVFFIVTASNSVGSSSISFAVTVAPSVAPVPELTVSNVTDTTADASWTAITGALSYTLQLGTDDDFAPASGYAEDFTSFASTSYSTDLASQTVDSGTWSYESVIMAPGGATNGVGSKGYAQLQASNGHLYLPAIDNPAKLTVVARATGGVLTLQQQVGGTWTDIDSFTLEGTGTAHTHTFANAGTSVALRLVAGTSATYVHDVSVVAADGTLVEEVTLPGWSHAFTNLSPSTLYCARVKADNSDWSEVELFETAAPAGTAPVWSAIPAQTVALGADCDLDLAPYVSGTAPVVISMADTALDAILIGTEFSFTPDAPGTYTFTFTATNDFGSADASLTVTATGTAPVLSLSPATESYSVAVGDPDIGFTVTATGNPAPAVAASCTEGAFFIFENGEFLFEPDTPGTYHFVFTATSSAGSDSKTVTVTVASSTPSVSATYTVTATNAVATTGTVPPGSSAEYASTYSKAFQLTSGNSMTLTLKGYAGATITGLTLSMRSNTSGGGGTLSATCGDAGIASIPDSKFNTTNWHGSWSTNYVPVTPAVARTTVDGDVVITIAASASSLYCEAFTVTYEPGTPAGTAPVWAELPAPTVAPNEAVYLVLSDYVTGATSIAMTADSSGEAVFDDENLDFLFASATPGTYTFTFRAANDYGSSDATLSVTVAASAAETLELFFHDQSATASTFTVQGTVPGRAYELLWTSDLRSGFTAQSIGTAASDTMIVPFPSTEIWFGRVRRAVP